MTDTTLHLILTVLYCVLIVSKRALELCTLIGLYS